MATSPLVVIKVGSNAITVNGSDATVSVDFSRIEDIAFGINQARQKGYRILLVTSGAVAGGMHQTHFTKRPGVNENIRLSSLSAIGQSQLMNNYTRAFEKFGITVAQGLPTRDDFHREVVNEHMKDTLLDLIELGCVPILNENDFTSFAEMRFGDNDIIASLVSILCGATQLVIYTVEDGLMTSNPKKDSSAELIEIVDEIIPEMFDEKQEMSAAGSGGVNSKIYSGDLCSHSGIRTSISNITQVRDLLDLLEGKTKCTRFRVKRNSLMPIHLACDIVAIQTSERSEPFFSVSNYLAP